VSGSLRICSATTLTTRPFSPAAADQQCPAFAGDPAVALPDTGEQTTLISPVSSSRLMKVIPLAVAGRCR